MDAGLDVAAAWAAIEAAVRPLGHETIDSEAACGRVLATAVQVDRDLPPFDRAAMDGFAVRADEVRAATPELPVRLRVGGESAPGAPFGGDAGDGTAVRIMTGAPVPTGYDAVVPVEETSGFEGAAVEVRRAVQAGQNLTPRGTERRAGEVVLAPGRRLGAADIGALATVGAARAVVGRRPRVAVLSTGNELVPHSSAPDASRIRNSNGPMLGALAAPFAAEVRRLGIAADNAGAIRDALGRGLESDLLLVTGGVSMGAYDLVADGLLRSGVQLHFDRVALQPGKPTTFGTHGRGIVLALPGNPVSALTTFRLFATVALRRLEGESEARPRWDTIPAAFAWQRRHAKWLLLPGRRSPDAGGRVELVRYAGSGDLLAYSGADCQVVLPPDRARVAPGDPVLVWPL